MAALITPPPMRGLDKLHRMEKVGEGTYGVVYKCWNKVSNDLCAVKIMSLHDVDGVPVNVIREISLLQEVSACSNVIEYVVTHLLLVVKHR